MALEVNPQLVNLITSQDLTSAYWTKTGYTATAANGVRETTSAAGHTFGMATALPRPAGVGLYQHTVDLITAGPDHRWVLVGLYAQGLGSGGGAYFDCVNGVKGVNSSYGGFTVPASSIAAAPGGGWRCSVTIQCGGALTNLVALEQTSNPNQGDFNYTGVVTDGFTVSNLGLYDMSTPVAKGAATPVVIVSSGPVYAGPATPYSIVSSGPVLPGKPIPVMVVTGRPVLPGPATPMMVVAGPPLPGPATPVT
jgi:hypothetical protein